MKIYKVGIIGATGMVGQRFIMLLKNHPWFAVEVLAASARSAGKTYEEAVNNRWLMGEDIPQKIKDMPVFDAKKDIEKIASMVDFVFCAVDMDKKATKDLETAYAKAECPVISNNSAHRFTPDVPMIIPEVNPNHCEVIKYQKKRLKTKRGFIAVKPNCSIQCYVPVLDALAPLGLKNVLVCTYQAISGAGRTFSNWPEMIDNIIPYIPGEEQKSEIEPLKIWGNIENGKIINSSSPDITSQCLRVPVSNGHMAAVFASFKNEPPAIEEIIGLVDNYKSKTEEFILPSAPNKFLHYFKDDDRPQAKLDRNLGGSMTISAGRMRKDSQYHIKFVCLSHNTIRGAAGGAVLMAELLCMYGIID